MSDLNLELISLEPPAELTLNSSQTKVQIVSDKVDDRKVIPYAYIRFANEAITMRKSLESIVEFCDRGIICYHENIPGIKSDASLAIAKAFVAKYPGFKLVKYPVPIIFHNSKYLCEHIYDGGISRYWLLDTFYNYALLHLIALAKANGEYDRAWIVKIDLDHIYNPKLLNYAREQAEALSDNYDSIFLTKYNVTRDYRKLFTPPTALQKLIYKGFENAKPSPHKAPLWFISHLREDWDHFFARLSALGDASFHFIFIKPNDWTSTNGEPFSNWERLIYPKTMRHYSERTFLTSYHFNREKQIFYNHNDLDSLNNQVYNQGHALTMHDQLPELEAYQDQVALDPEFWTPQHLLQIFKSLNYPADGEPQPQYSRESANFDMLINDPQFRIENYLIEFNQRRNSALEGSDLRYELDIDAEVMNKLFHEYTVDIERYQYQ